MSFSNLSQWKTSVLGAIVMASTLYYWFYHPIIMKKFEIISDTNYWAIAGGCIISMLLFVAPDRIIDIASQFIKGVTNKIGGVSEPTSKLPEVPNIDMPPKQ